MASLNPTTPATPPQRLRRLPGRMPSLRSSRTTPSATLWLDGSQLVQENVRNYTQEIQRFALRDIQAVQIRRTARGMVYNIILAGLLALVLFGFWSAWSTDSKGAVFLTTPHLLGLALFAGPLVLLLLVNVLRGATCRAVLTTALGPQPLPSLSRMRPARRALDAIIASVEAVQGAIPPDETTQRIDHAQAGQR